MDRDRRGLKAAPWQFWRLRATLERTIWPAEELVGIFSELKRRNVFKVGLAYLVLGWLLLQVTDVVVPILELPDWVSRLVLFLLALGFPLVVLFSWAFELTPEGIKRERDVDRSESITAHTGRRLDYTIIALLVLALGLFAWERFVAQPVGNQPTAQAQPGAAEDGVMGSASIPVVAVLPFKATGSDDGGFLAAGLHDDMLTRLAKLGAFRVISRTSMTEYAETTKSMPEIGRELGASYILEGGVQALENRVRINAQLIDAPSDTHLWAEVYDRQLTAADLFDIQAELAVAIVEAMRTTISPEDRALVQETPTENMAAYAAYLRAMQLAQNRGFVGLYNLDVVRALEEAVELDPEFAEAWAQLSIWRTTVAGPTRDPEIAEAALAALMRVRSLRPDLLEAELAWAEYLYRIMREYGQAVEVLESLGDRVAGHAQALELKSWLYRRLGRYREAYQVGLDVVQLEPRSPTVAVFIAMIAPLFDDCDTAEVYAQRALALAPELADIKSQVAHYELECNGDALRAQQLLKDLDLSVVFDTWRVALWAAIHLRDIDWLLSVIETEFQNPGPMSAHVYPLLNKAWLYRFLEPDEEKHLAYLASAEQALQAIEADVDVAGSLPFAGAMLFFSGIARNPDGVRYWHAEYQRRFQDEFKGDVFWEGRNHLYYSQSYASAGLLEEALAELRTMLEEPGGHRFPLVDGFPEYDVLRDHPEYIELRERFGSVNLETHPDQH